MAEFLIYDKDHWMDALTQEQISEYVKKYPNFQAKYDARYQRGDPVEAGPNKYWTGPKASGYDKSVFLLVIMSWMLIGEAKKYTKPLYAQFPISILNEETGEFEEEWERRAIKRRRYNFSNVTDKQVINYLSEITIKDKSLG